MRSKFLLFLKIFVVLLISQAILCHGDSGVASSSEDNLEVTTKKTGWFKSFFGGKSKTTTEATPTSTTTTTVRPTKPSVPVVPTPSRGNVAPPNSPNPSRPPVFGSGQEFPGFPPRREPYGAGGNKHSLMDLSYSSQRPIVVPTKPSVSSTTTASTTSTTTATTTIKSQTKEQFPALPAVKVTPPAPASSATSTTTTTTKRTTAKDEFPGLPTPKTPYIKDDFPALPAARPSAGASTTTTTPSSPSAWGTTPKIVGGPNIISVPTTPKPFMPTPTANSHRYTSSTPRDLGASSTQTSVATDAEIMDLTETLFTKETNSKLKDLTVNYQGQTRSSYNTDDAPNPLFQNSDEALKSYSITKMRQLLNNYELDTKVNEYVTPMERKEENEFLDTIMVTGIIRQTMSFLQNKGIVGPDPLKQRELLKTIWFTMYSRGLGKIGSSAFEHVFLAEKRDQDVIGLHNWVYFLEEEKAGHADYKGYMKKLELGNKAVILKFRFSLNDIMKPTTTMFIGSSPELEMALYTLCFQLRPDADCPVSMGGQKFNIVTHSFRYRGKTLIGAAFPEI